MRRMEPPPDFQPIKGSALGIPAEPLTGWQRLFGALRAPRTAMRWAQRVQDSRSEPHRGPNESSFLARTECGQETLWLARRSHMLVGRRRSLACPAAENGPIALLISAFLKFVGRHLSFYQPQNPRLISSVTRAGGLNALHILALSIHAGDPKNRQ
jgi:hypothetical protein